MDFNWDIGNIEDFERLWEERADGRTLLNRVTVALIDASAQVGIPEIIKENWAAFAARVASFQAVATALVVIVENGWYTPLSSQLGTPLRQRAGCGTSLCHRQCA
jgi:hypothetical protein